MGIIEYSNYNNYESTNNNDVIECEIIQTVQASEVEYNKIDCKDKIYDSYRWILRNKKDICIIISIIIFIIGINTINFIFYILGSVYGDDWPFLMNPISSGFYIFYMILCIISTTGLLSYIIHNQYKNHIITWIIFFISTGILISIPFAIASHLIYIDYRDACDNYIYEYTIHDNSMYIEGNKIYDISSSNIGTTKIKITAGPLPDSSYRMEQIYENGLSNDGKVIIYYDKKIEVDKYKSTSASWYRNPMKLLNKDGNIYTRTLKSPFNPDEYKICMNNYGNETLQVSIIVPILQHRMKKCTQCMESCMSECVRWDTRIITYDTTTCDSKGKCIIVTHYSTETYCAQYRSYGECSNRCRYPSCIGIGL